MNENIHKIFPTLVFEDYYDHSEDFLKTLSTTWKDHFTNGYSNELTNNQLQMDERHKSLYTFLTNSVKKYLKACEVADNFDINFVKSWFNVLDKATTPIHDHADAHISVVYYANTPKDTDQFIRFHYFNEKRQPFPGIYNLNSVKHNEFNSQCYSIKAHQGQVLVFSSEIPHDTLGHGKIPNIQEDPVMSFYDLKKKRVCIASDVILTYREKQHKSLGLQPIKNWRTFNE